MAVVHGQREGYRGQPGTKRDPEQSFPAKPVSRTPSRKPPRSFRLGAATCPALPQPLPSLPFMHQPRSLHTHPALHRAHGEEACIHRPARPVHPQAPASSRTPSLLGAATLRVGHGAPAPEAPGGVPSYLHAEADALSGDTCQALRPWRRDRATGQGVPGTGARPLPPLGAAPTALQGLGTPEQGQHRPWDTKHAALEMR